MQYYKFMSYKSFYKRVLGEKIVEKKEGTKVSYKKNEEGDFKMNGNGFALSNWGMKHKPHDIEWEADENMWGGVIAMINSGHEVIESVKSR